MTLSCSVTSSAHREGGPTCSHYTRAPRYGELKKALGCPRAFRNSSNTLLTKHPKGRENDRKNLSQCFIISLISFLLFFPAFSCIVLHTAHNPKVVGSNPAPLPNLLSYLQIGLWAIRGYFLIALLFKRQCSPRQGQAPSFNVAEKEGFSEF